MRAAYVDTSCLVAVAFDEPQARDLSDRIATALYLAEAPGDLAFLSLDRRQADLAAELGFVTPLG